MTVTKDETHPDQINKVSSNKFSEMNGSEKLRFLGKFVVFLVSAGFLFPTILSD